MLAVQCICIINTISIHNLYNPSVAIPASPVRTNARSRRTRYIRDPSSGAHRVAPAQHWLPPTPLPYIHPRSIIHCRGLILMSTDYTDWIQLYIGKTDWERCQIFLVKRRIFNTYSISIKRAWCSKFNINKYFLQKFEIWVWVIISI